MKAVYTLFNRIAPDVDQMSVSEYRSLHIIKRDAVNGTIIAVNEPRFLGTLPAP